MRQFVVYQDPPLFLTPVLSRLKCAQSRVHALLLVLASLMSMNVSVSNIIKSTVFAACVLGSTTSLVQARDLFPKERSVCSSLKMCLDIVRRHDASEFDYDILGTEYQRFGPKGKAALFSLLESGIEHTDVAHLISALGPLTTEDRQRVQKKWSQEKAGSYLPLLLDGHPRPVIFYYKVWDTQMLKSVKPPVWH